VLREYKSFIVKMHMGAPKNKLVVKNLDLLCDLELVFGLPCNLPILEVVHKLIKYIQKCDVFIIDFLDAVKSIKVQIYWLYVDPFCTYKDFFSLSLLLFVNIIMNSCPSFGLHVKMKQIFIARHFWCLILVIKSMGSIIMELLKVFNIHVHHFHEVKMFHIMKATCLEVATKLCSELFCRFPNVEIMATLGMVYPQYWLCEKIVIKNF